MINTDPNHIHTYDAEGNMTCCSLEEKIYQKAAVHNHAKEHDGHPHEHEHDHSPEGLITGSLKAYMPAIISFILLITGLLFDHSFHPDFFKGGIRLGWYIFAYVMVGLPVVKEAWVSIIKGQFFTEFLLMTIATVGAFAIGDYPEGVAVMLFYAIGELFQSAAVSKAKGNIKALLDVRPDTATVLRNGDYITVNPEQVQIAETIQIKAGEKVPLDGLMLSEISSFNTAALTGESKPATIRKNEQVLAGMLNLDKLVEVKVTKKFADSSLARILDLVQNATTKKAKTELFIRGFAKVYTPIVVFLAIALTLLPYFFIEHYVFSEWLYRALIFLVISCPCALVISIPLGYFGGIGAASRNGILFKGSNYLDLMAKVNTVVMDKTGTLTKGIFKVQDVNTNGWEAAEFLRLVAALESKSTHPVAKAITEFSPDGVNGINVEQVEEISGHGLKGKVNGYEILAGNSKLMDKFNIYYNTALHDIVESIVFVSINGKYAGYITIADEIKEDAKQAIKEMHQNGVKETIMLSGDKSSITQKIAKLLGIDVAFGDLLPENKVQKVEELKREKSKVIAFVGDGINDAPVLALADIGIAMGGMGSDAAIETADVVIQTDQPSKIATAIKIGKATKSIVWQNITLAFAVKVIVLILGAGGLATMWEAVFADVGVALLAILNAVRIQKMNL